MATADPLAHPHDFASASDSGLIGRAASASDSDLIGRAAVALFSFDGDGGPELSFDGGASLIVYDEVEVGRGWALGQYDAQMGLIPVGYFVFVDAIAPPTPMLEQRSSPPQSFVPRRMSVDQARTPELVRAPPTLPISTDFSSGHQFAPTRSAPEPTITIQRPSRVLKTIKAHGRSWASAGAAQWVLDGGPDCAEAERLYVDVGVAPAWREVDAPFDVVVHDARTRSDHTIFSVTSYHPAREPHTVIRRFSHFVPLETILRR